MSFVGRRSLRRAFRLTGGSGKGCYSVWSVSQDGPHLFHTVAVIKDLSEVLIEEVEEEEERGEYTSQVISAKQAFS